ncbi:hypothetical protein AVEN_194636-1 [Araneus ventricosus]|uniref:Tc1-like transposase DDE domain-containing protein n=1 Tax=Araneus ventricosus TaxID=182803 RepID=A0A4Y2A7S0_ARAVE|nr:hypothetical protein AVEN_194636-1 [Araneus ventricosus]
MDAKNLKSALAFSMEYKAARTVSKTSRHVRSIEMEDDIGREQESLSLSESLFNSQVSQNDVLVAATLVDLKREAIPVRVLNLKNKPKIVDKGAVIATCEPEVDIAVHPQEFSKAQHLPSILENLEGLNEEQQHFQWTPKSPNMNIIEDIWDALLHVVEKRSPPPRTSMDLLTALQDSWCEFPPGYLQTLVESMPHRFASLLRVHGGQTRY